MASVTYIRPVESVHGKLKKTDQVGYAMRSKSKTKFTVTREDWSRKFKDAAAAQEAAQHNAKFAAVSRLVAARAIDPTKMDDDAVAFRNQSKYSTMRGFLFAEEWANYQG